MKTTITFISFLLVLVINAQQKISFTLLFASDGHTLTTGSKRAIDSVCKKLVNTPKAYSVSIVGHTDNKGDLAYNEALSTRRSETVKKQLMQHGFDKRLISTDAFAFLQPVANNEMEEGKAKNRRVQVTISLLKPDMSLVAERAPLTMNYSFKNNQETNISYPSGTKMHVPADAFVHADGSPVSGSVTIQYTEYRNVADFMTSDIPMSFKNETGEFVQFNSAGMFRIEAINDNKKLLLKPPKRIDVDFAMTGKVPDMQVFKLNERSKKWRVAPTSVKAPALSNNTSFVDGYFDGCAVVYKGVDYCTLSPEYASNMAIRVGHKLANSSEPIFLKRARHYFVRSNYKMPTFRLEVIGRHSKTVRFRLVPQVPIDSKLDVSEFEWTYKPNEKHPFKDNWEQVLWLRAKLEYRNERVFCLLLSSNEEDLRLPVKCKLANHPMSRTDLKTFYRRNHNSDLKYLLDQKSRDEDFSEVVQRSPARRLKDDQCSDSLYCFFQWSQQWMSVSTGEKNMSFRAWLDFFNLNKEMMTERFNYLKSNQDSVLAALRTTLASKRSYDSYFPPSRYSQQNAFSEMVQSVGVTELGVWNCDQISRLKEPVIVEKTYRDKDGKKIEPTSLFVLDPSVNGILVFNGHYDLSPYNFQVSSRADNTLIAFDNQNNLFLCNASDFSKTLASNSQVITLSAVSSSQVQDILKAWPQ